MTEEELFEAIRAYYQADDDRAEVVEAYVNLVNSVERGFRGPGEHMLEWLTKPYESR